jgi:flavin reductase (DIM6/NTAB) family NADH-FMN oxidoreductase RutF
VSRSSPADQAHQDPDPSPSAGPDELRRVFRRHAAAVGVITASHQGAPVGLLVTSLASVSPSPPLISFNVARASSSWPALETVDPIGMHVLGAEQEALARRFARKGVDRFSAPTSWRVGPHDIPVLDGVAAWAVAAIEQRVDVGDHVIVVARLLHADARDDADPLVHHNGEYRQVGTRSNRLENRSPASLFAVARTAGESG